MYTDKEEKGCKDVSYSLKTNKKVIKENYKLPSRYQPEDKVNLNFFDAGFVKNCKIIKVHFTESKVLYDVEVNNPCTRIYNIDSCFLEDIM